MIALILAKFPWLRTALAALPWVLAAGGAIGTMGYRSAWESCKASVANDALKAAEKVAAAKEADATFTRVLEEQLRPVVAAIQDQAHATSVALAKVKSDPNCARTDAGRAFDLGVRPGGQQARPGPTDAPRP